MLCAKTDGEIEQATGERKSCFSRIDSSSSARNPIPSSPRHSAGLRVKSSDVVARNHKVEFIRFAGSIASIGWVRRLSLQVKN